MRESCLYCVRKHLSQAWVLRGECSQGYPHHRALVIGHLAEAADEAAQVFPSLAAAIRKERLAYEKNKHYCPDFAGLLRQVEQALTKQGLDGLSGATEMVRLGSLFVFGIIGYGILWYKTRPRK